MLGRRELVKLMGVATIGSILVRDSNAANNNQEMQSGQGSAPFSLPPLPYAYDALEPYIDTQTMRLHHDKHHAAYVKNLNAAVSNYPDLAKLPVEELVRNWTKVPEPIRQTVRNNGGGHANHSFFWPIMQKDAPGQPKGELAGAIDRKFGSFSGFQEQFTKAALSVFGSGWAWLSLDGKKELFIETTPNQDSPWMGRESSGLRDRRLGACLLSQVSESSGGLRGSVLSSDFVGYRERALPQGIESINVSVKRPRQ